MLEAINRCDRLIYFKLAIFLVHAYNLNSSNLEPMVSPERHGPDEEEIIKVQKKGGKSRQCLFLLLIIFAIIAGKLLQFHNNSLARCACSRLFLLKVFIP